MIITVLNEPQANKSLFQGKCANKRMTSMHYYAFI